MRLPRILMLLVLYLIIIGVCYSQKPQTSTIAPNSKTQDIKGSPAYAEILLKRAELESDLESLLITYTEDFPKVKASRFELGLLQKDLQNLLAQPDAGKLTLALGKLMVR